MPSVMLGAIIQQAPSLFVSFRNLHLLHLAWETQHGRLHAGRNKTTSAKACSPFFVACSMRNTAWSSCLCPGDRASMHTLRPAHHSLSHVAWETQDGRAAYAQVTEPSMPTIMLAESCQLAAVWGQAVTYNWRYNVEHTLLCYYCYCFLYYGFVFFLWLVSPKRTVSPFGPRSASPSRAPRNGFLGPWASARVRRRSAGDWKCVRFTSAFWKCCRIRAKSRRL